VKRQGGSVLHGVDKLLALEDIRQLAVRYSHFRDMLYLDELAGLFAEDAVCEFGERFGGNVVGRPAIRRHFEGSKHIGGGKPFGTMHAISTHWIEFKDAETAEGRCFLTDFVLNSKDNPLKYLIIYDDGYRKVDGEWKFQRRSLQMVWPDWDGYARMLGQV
jgi:hypothetical protein